MFVQRFARSSLPALRAPLATRTFVSSTVVRDVREKHVYERDDATVSEADVRADQTGLSGPPDAELIKETVGSTLYEDEDKQLEGSDAGAKAKHAQQNPPHGQTGSEEAVKADRDEH